MRGLETAGSSASNCVWKTELKSSSSGLSFSVVTVWRLLKASKPGLEVGVTAGLKVVTMGAEGVVGALKVVISGCTGSSSSKSSSLRLGLVKNSREALKLGEGVVEVVLCDTDGNGLVVSKGTDGSSNSDSLTSNLG